MHLEHARGRVGSARKASSTSRIFGAMLNSCFDTLRGGSDVASAIAAGRAVIRAHRSRRATAPRTPTTAARRAAAAPRSPAARPPGPIRSGRPIGMSTATTAGAPAPTARRRSAARSARARRRPVGRHERHDPAARAAVDPGEPDIVVAHLIAARWHGSCDAARLPSTGGPQHDHPPAPQRALHAGLERPRASTRRGRCRSTA